MKPGKSHIDRHPCFVRKSGVHEASQYRPHLNVEPNNATVEEFILAATLSINNGREKGRAIK